MGDTVSRPRIWLNALLFGLTVLSTFFVGLAWGWSFVSAPSALSADPSSLDARTLLDPRVVLLGGLYAIVLLTILAGHELGHYLSCKRYGIAATLPYFIPAPTLVGTLGAVIKIKSPITLKHQLFDIGAAGPLAGFGLAVPAIAVGLAFSKVLPMTPSEDSLFLGEPLLFKILSRVILGTPPEGYALVLHPVGFAGWVGAMVTAFNLFPVGQMDGGHIAYALAGKRAGLLSRLMLGVFVVLGVFFWAGWLVWAAVVYFLGLRHPRIMDEEAPLSTGRKILGALIVLIFILSFIPDPVQGYDAWTLLKRIGLGVK